MKHRGVRPSIEARWSPISDAECRRIHDIHLGSLSDDVMPNFGYDVERRYLHALSGHGGAVILARVEGEIVGFLLLRFAALDMRRFLDFRALIQFLSASLERPKIFARLVHQLVKATPNPQGSAEIDYFAVDERYRGRGIGVALLEEAEKLTLQRGLRAIFTKTNNEKLLRHYTDERGARTIFRLVILKDVYHGVVWDVGPR